MSEAPETAPPAGEPPTDDWKHSAGEFLNARLELIRLEAREAGRQAAKRAAVAVFVVGAAFLCWALVMAGLVGLIAAWNTTVPWHLAALGLGGLHLLAAAAGLLFLRRSSGPAFPLTRSELLKDREWLDQILHKTPKSPR